MKCIPLSKMDYSNSGCTDLMRIMKLESSSNAKYIRVRRQETSHSVSIYICSLHEVSRLRASILFSFPRESFLVGTHLVLFQIV